MKTELDEKIKNRDTELQRHYDYAKDSIYALKRQKEKIENEISHFEKILRRCEERAIEQGCLHIL